MAGAVACVRVPFLLKTEQYSLVRGCHVCLPIHPSVDVVSRPRCQALGGSDGPRSSHPGTRLMLLGRGASPLWPGPPRVCHGPGAERAS